MKRYFHVRILDSKRQVRNLIEDLSEEIVASRVVFPYEYGHPITLSGVTYDPFDIDEIEIVTSNETLYALAMQMKESKGRKISTNTESWKRWAFSECLQVTNEYIVGAPGFKSSLLQLQRSDSRNSADPHRVFLVHGRDLVARDGVVTLIQAVGLSPVGWSEAKRATGKASPYVGEILEAGFGLAHAALILLTPDDEGKVREQFLQEYDSEGEREYTGQARQNVILEAGMALAWFPERTVIVEMGHLRKFSDLEGRHTVRLTNHPTKRLELLQSLLTAGCEFSVALDANNSWMTIGEIRLTGAATS